MFAQVLGSLQKLDGKRVSSKECLSQCKALRLSLQKGPEALQAFTARHGILPATVTHAIVQEIMLTRDNGCRCAGAAAAAE